MVTIPVQNPTGDGDHAIYKDLDQLRPELAEADQRSTSLETSYWDVNRGFSRANKSCLKKWLVPSGNLT